MLWYSNMASFHLTWLILSMITMVFSDIDMRFTRSPESVTMPLGDVAEFDCSVNVPADKIEWKFRRIHQNNWSYLNTSDAVKINSESRQDSSKVVVQLRNSDLIGEYMCVVRYGAIALASIPGRLILANLEVPDSAKDRIYTAPLNNIIILHCNKPKSTPPAVISYFKIGPGGIKSNVTSHDGAMILHRSNYGDSGTYGCRAINELSGQMKEIPGRIHLNIEDNEGILLPRFMESFEYVGDSISDDELPVVSGVPGGSVSIMCGLIGTPAPKVTWSRDNGGGLTNRARIDSSTQILTINNIKPDDEGIYRCSSAGDTWRSWRVKVKRGAAWLGQITQIPPITEGQPVTIRCESPTGTQPYTITWMLNAETIIQDDNVKIEENSLYIGNVEKIHAGIVQCFISNEYNTDYRAILLRVVPVQINGEEYDSNVGSNNIRFPTNNSGGRRKNRKNGKQKQIKIPPSRPNITRLSDESVMVNWKSPSVKNTLWVQIFKVQYKDMNSTDNNWRTANDDLDNHTTSYAVDGLEPNHLYKFRIAAVYSNQDTDVGKVSTFYLQRGVGFKEPPAPTFTDATALSTTKLLINWTFSTSEVAVNGFYVHYRETHLADKYIKMIVDTPDARSAIISHLKPDTPYEIKIQSFTMTAPSQFSVIRVARTEKPPQVLTTQTDVNVIGAGGVGGSGGVETSGGDRGTGGIYAPAAGAAAGVVGLLVLLLLVLLRCKRRQHNHDGEKPSVEESPVVNGYMSSKHPITITSNPLHAESSDVSVEMSYLHNNNCNGGNIDNNSQQENIQTNRIIKTYNHLHHNPMPQRNFV